MKTYLLYITIAALTLFHAIDALSQEELDLRAIASYLKGSYAETRYDLYNAYRFYSEAESYDRGNPRIRIRLASVSLGLGDLDGARQNAEALLGLPIYDSEARLILARISEIEGDTDGALKYLTDLLDSDDVSRFEVLKSLSMIYLKLERIDDARAALEQARDLFSEDVNIHVSLGYIYHETGEIEKAIASFERAIEINPQHTRAHLALASIYYLAGRVDEAKQSYRTVLDQEPTNDVALQELANLMLEAGEYENGIELLEPLFKDGKLDSGGKVALGRFYYRADRGEDALGIFKELLESNPDNPALLRIIAEIEVELHKFKTAYGYLRKLIGIEPDNFSNYVGLLLIGYGAAGDPSEPGEAVTIPEDELKGYLDIAVSKVNETSADETFILGAILRQVGEMEQAGEFLLKAEGLNPDDRRILLEVATYFEHESRFDEALERVIRVHEMNPEDASVLNFYGYLLAEKGDQLDLAEELLNRALEKEPENGYFLDSLGWIKYRKGDYEEALRLLLQAVGEAGEDAVIWEHLGQTYEKLGQRREAAEAYEKSLEVEPDNDMVRERLTNLGRSPAEN